MARIFSAIWRRLRRPAGSSPRLDGRWVVGDQVQIMIELELVEQTQEQLARATE